MRKAKASPAENSNNQNSGGNATLHSVSSTVPQQSPPAPTTGAVPSAPPAPEHESFSFYNRVRRSLRGMKNPKTEELSKNMVTSEVYQVPSMYPNLEQTEQAVSGGGIENPEFKSEE
ncbi:hypothetical protein HNY73_002328 [Argiope bruennichi]|uniref:Uncharacterized protein n=1 Tax=Argiope bruennichi TaxID=94029 RepID=A0A8T0FT59_ARGBR|nr:hypothetical protein HNY73_002328 [Argiope bruennichi]